MAKCQCHCFSNGCFSNKRLSDLNGHPSFHSFALRIHTTDTLIIDEIFIISAKILQQFVFICSNLRDKAIPSGGLQIIVCRGFWQFKPVPDYLNNDPGAYCFTSSAWAMANSYTEVLYEEMHLHDREPVEAINEFSTGIISKESLAYLRSSSRPLKDGNVDWIEFSVP